MTSKHIVSNPVMRLVARPQDANSRGDMFGGWLMGQMDLAGAIVAGVVAGTEIVTIAVNAMRFLKPVLVNDYLEFFAEVLTVGNTSISTKIEVYTKRRQTMEQEWVKVAVAEIVYVAIAEIGKPCKVKNPKAALKRNEPNE
ncbi:MAG: thioesterase superfamily protein [Gammaproteobacteria bacterium]|jgi:acyl-CoA thioesterase YciA|nr:thioesterase superfamily protein [Gammaproteobacteria bacterium]